MYIYINTPGLIITFHQSGVFLKTTMIPGTKLEKITQVLRGVTTLPIWLSLNKASKWAFVGIRRQTNGAVVKTQTNQQTNYNYIYYLFFSFFRKCSQATISLPTNFVTWINWRVFLLQVRSQWRRLFLATWWPPSWKSESTFEWSWNLDVPGKLVNG